MSANLLNSEELRDQIVLIVDGPIAGEAEAFPQPEYRRESRRMDIFDRRRFLRSGVFEGYQARSCHYG